LSDLSEVPIPADELERLLQNAGRAVLVGGQALAFWIAFYAVQIEDVPGAIVTKDADFLGSREDAHRFSIVIGGTLEYPKTMSILAGVVRKKISATEEFEVDVLRTLNGLSAAEVQKHAKKIVDSTNGAQYLVMSPIDCLISRLENLRTIAEKQTEEGVWQARVAVRVVRACISELLKNGQEREAIRSATEILRAATHAMGVSAFRKYGIDVLESVPLERYQTKSFIEQQWRRSVSRVKEVRSVGASHAVQARNS
jgi:hypothetical protein